MKRLLFTIISVLGSCTFSFSTSRGAEIDSLLQLLDKTIAKRAIYTSEKEKKINEIKRLLAHEHAPEKRYQLNNTLIAEYQSFICDSALGYIDRNIQLASTLNNREFMDESRLRLAFVLSISGLFTQASDVFDSIEYKSLPHHLKVFYCWGYIRYNENLIKYTDHPKYETVHIQEIARCRDTLMRLLGEDTDTYLKEKSFKLKAEGAFEASAEIQTELFKKEQVNSHGYAMAAMGLSMIHKELGNQSLQEKYLLLAAITDVRLAVKENESLLTLAIYLHEQGDVNRAYNYIQAALDDANFYNSRFRNAVIARTQPKIEAMYLTKIEQQRRNLRSYALAISVFLVVLIGTLYFLYKQIKTVSRARKHLNTVNAQLMSANHRLDEANLIRERYIGYYINQCAVYLDKLDEFRKSVSRKIKAGQLAELEKLSATTATLEKDAQELYTDFDSTFLEVYPDFVEGFNALLRADERYVLKKDHLNTELRIFALIRLGITDVNQIATFLRYSIQTIYNYKSKVKGKAAVDIEHFEENVKKIGTLRVE
ncbi:DUF6377 domain-containing protein [Parapedobacter indicus]|uniref:DUF6377 domain-containing protein n=1 Tax=Parapedobacter indicus TaxID=1477437 RepID=A0A1I3D3J1_9SPHI|nr:DUF6377 domain-containing protein [Parapedobacter indicus]PPL04513.1 hypothetical protein CLV26_101315 [Parapedobacter indicus]SFH81310.1 hypothetical protein SAMN05444682_101302 [Parapedobacter indicus]